MDDWEEESPVQQQPHYQQTSTSGSGGGGYNQDGNSTRYNSRSYDNSNRRENRDRLNNDRGERSNRFSEQGDRNNRYQTGQGDRNNRYQDQNDRGNRYQGQNNRYQDQGERENRYQDRRTYGGQQERREPSDQYSQNKRPYKNDSYECSESMEVDPNHIKFIIGKGGSKIREIESTCGVKLQIDKNDNNVKISGATMEDTSKIIDAIINTSNNKIRCLD